MTAELSSTLLESGVTALPTKLLKKRVFCKRQAQTTRSQNL